MIFSCADMMRCYNIRTSPGSGLGVGVIVVHDDAENGVSEKVADDVDDDDDDDDDDDHHDDDDDDHHDDDDDDIVMMMIL